MFRQQHRLFATSCRRLRHNDHRVVQVVQKRIAERVQIQSELTEGMSTPKDIATLRQLKESETLQNAWDEFNTCRQLLEETRALLDDPDPTMRSMATEEYRTLYEQIEELVNTTLPGLLIPPSPTRHLSAMVELKAGVGGVEACLFLADMLRMYQRYVERSGRWKFTMVSQGTLEEGGARDALMEVQGDGAYDHLRWESGVHRVQRVPSTDASGRVHTSTVAVIVLPLTDEKVPESEQLYKMEDIKLEVMRARGAGGQHVNKTESADERSQHTNRRRAFQVLQARLMDRKITQDIADKRATKNNLVSGVDRSDKIRTYNYAQERVTDHRIGLTMRNLTSVLEGDGIGGFIDALQKNFDETTMEQMLEV